MPNFNMWYVSIGIIFFIILFSIQYSLNSILKTNREIKKLLELIVNRDVYK